MRQKMTDRDGLIYLTGTTYEQITSFLDGFHIPYTLVKQPRRRAGYQRTAEILLTENDARTLDMLGKIVGPPTRSAPSNNLGNHFYHATFMSIDGKQGTSKLDSDGNLRERVIVRAPVQSHSEHMGGLFRRVKSARRIISGRG